MKPSKTISEQIEILKSRNLIIEDEIKAGESLLKYNYYRLSGYWRKYQKKTKEKYGDRDDNFVDNTTFEKILVIYELDALLATLLLEGIRVFEVCFRTRFAYYMAHSKPDGQFLYVNPDSYNEVKVTKKEKPKVLHNTIESEINQNSYDSKVNEKEEPKDLHSKIESEIYRSKDRFIRHYIKKEKDENKIPIWVAVELLSFGTISQMYSRWKDKEVVKKVSTSFNFFKSYNYSIHIIRSFVVLRNSCAHHARIWNRKLAVKINNKITDKIYLREIETIKENSQWRLIATLMALVDEINKNESYSTRIMKLCKKNEEFYKGLINPTL